MLSRSLAAGPQSGDGFPVGSPGVAGRAVGRTPKPCRSSAVDRVRGHQGIGRAGRAGACTGNPALLHKRESAPRKADTQGETWPAVRHRVMCASDRCPGRVPLLQDVFRFGDRVNANVLGGGGIAVSSSAIAEVQMVIERFGRCACREVETRKRQREVREQASDVGTWAERRRVHGQIPPTCE